MTKTTYTLIALGTGAIIGGLISQIVTEKVMEKKFEREFEEERKKIKEYYQNKYEAITINGGIYDGINLDTEGEALEPQEPNPGETKFSKASIDYHTVDTHKTNYATQKLDNNEEYTFKERERDKDIYVVDFEEGCEADPGWDMVGLKYYCEDGVLTDEHDIPVDETIVGDGLDHFGEDPNDPNTVYVKNHKLKKVYEIVALDASYAFDVIGVDPDSYNKKTNKKGREE